MFSPQKRSFFPWGRAMFLGVLGEKYSGSEITFLGRHQLATEIFFSRQMESVSIISIVSIKFFFLSETQVFQEKFSHESIPTPERS